MWNASRTEGHLTRTDIKLILANLNNVLAFEHEPELVFVRVNVKGRVERVDFFDDSKRSVSRIGRGPDDELCTAESEAFTALCTTFEAANLFHSGNGIGFADSFKAEGIALELPLLPGNCSVQPSRSPICSEIRPLEWQVEWQIRLKSAPDCSPDTSGCSVSSQSSLWSGGRGTRTHKSFRATISSVWLEVLDRPSYSCLLLSLLVRRRVGSWVALRVPGSSRSVR
jgi:hypothetical protein